MTGRWMAKNELTKRAEVLVLAKTSLSEPKEKLLCCRLKC